MKRRVRYMWLCGAAWFIYMAAYLVGDAAEHMVAANVWLAAWFVVSAMGGGDD